MARELLGGLQRERCAILHSIISCMESERRRVLINRMLGAKTTNEVEEAEDAAKEWMEDHPQDLQVVAARERLAKTDAKLKEPRRRAKQVGWAVFIVTSLTVALLVGIVSGRWSLAVGGGLLVGGTLAEVTWIFGGRDIND